MIRITLSKSESSSVYENREVHEHHHNHHGNDNSNSDNGNGNGNGNGNDGYSETAFCQGTPMAMFMDGLHWSLHHRSNSSKDDDDDDNININNNRKASPQDASLPRCLNYLVSSWILKNKTQFRIAMLFSFLLAIVMEGLSAVRIWVVGYVGQSSPWRGILLTLIYAFQAVMGYTIMFVAMMYSVELLLSVAVGLAIGNAIFLSLLNINKRRPGDDSFLSSSLTPGYPGTVDVPEGTLNNDAGDAETSGLLLASVHPMQFGD